MNVAKVCNWSLKSRSSKVDLKEKKSFEKKDMTPQLRLVAKTLQQRLCVRQDCRILQARGIFKLMEELMTTITGSENFTQPNEQSEDDIVTKRYHKPTSLHIFANEFVSKAALDQNTKGYFTTHSRRLVNFDDGASVDNNDVDDVTSARSYKNSL
ncbi:hypothetical protein RFI_38982 [Reticulomyxa filosa]|uniref:Uncharacterized protein n=1 Tax=Reticulomyxa filosa TaxID=46433 RepID=X6LAX6_RETFI|nr:hypothetical protein RFI_38982 [Reticulomyxa filosa]|eukprot:ETN98510.1 hypothetical protein RFI_38982 [Reticulomyxa filosa]